VAKDKVSSQSSTGIAAQSLEEFKDQTQSAIEQYFSLLQNTMSALPWNNTNLNRILLSHATQNVTATFAFVQKLSEAKNFQDVVKIQTEFMNTQLKFVQRTSKERRRAICQSCC
jgi:hypothetical protein